MPFGDITEVYFKYIKIEQFGDDYFYTLGLNNKFCNGISNFNQNDTLRENVTVDVLGMINQWRDKACSRDAYQLLNKALEQHIDNRTIMKQCNWV